ncbi:YegP family protein [Sulfurimonas sp.]|uniref:YegP family protein n=1 Tax=Sulfurimonas sp. TaxID=2022749 RepID=UPI0026130684|nr:YegP family protein [Sulfurimonas sp.]MDD5156828.1 YegP family protein [Sulfurimonas sp.]
MAEDKKNGYYVLTKNINATQPYRYVLKAPNHETILSSENYTTSRNARNGIESTRVNGIVEEHFEKRTSKADEPYFVLKATNGEIIGVSEMYSSTNACEHGIKAVIKYAAQASLVDETGSDGDNGSEGPVITNNPVRSKSNKYA